MYCGCYNSSGCCCICPLSIKNGNRIRSNTMTRTVMILKMRCCRCRYRHIINVVTYNIMYCDCCTSSNKRCCTCSLSRYNNSNIRSSTMMPTWFVVL